MHVRNGPMARPLNARQAARLVRKADGSSARLIRRAMTVVAVTAAVAFVGAAYMVVAS